MAGLFTELRRRNMFRVAGVYAVVGWILAQASGVLEDALGLPPWFDTLVVSLLLIGFPIAMLLAWAFEMTPEGVVRTEDVDAGESEPAKPAKALDFVIVGALVLVGVLIVGSRFMPQKTISPKDVVQTEPSKQAQPQNSIAVLPFVNMSSDPEQEYFSDGISEELLNVLAKIKGLKVAGRTSSFSFKGKNQDLREIGEVLNVAHILEGSVRKSGAKVRITAQLVRSDNGFHLWSETYDRELIDIFAVQDEISNAILSEMREFLPGAEETTKPTARVEISAYDLYLLAREKITQGGKRQHYEEAASLLNRAIAIDDQYAPALGWRAYVAGGLSDGRGQPGNIPLAEILPVMKSFVDKALAIDDTSPEGLLGLASYYALFSEEQGKVELEPAINTLRKAISIQPNLTQAANDLAYFLLNTDKPEYEAEAMTILADVLDKDPALAHANNNYTDQLMSRGHIDEAEQVLLRWARVSPESSSPVEKLSIIYLQNGELAKGWNFVSAQRKRFPLSATLYFSGALMKTKLSAVKWLQQDPAPEAQAVGMMLSGQDEKALKLLTNSAFVGDNLFFALTSLVPVQFAIHDYAGLARFYDRRLNTKDKRAEAYQCKCAGLAYIADSLRKTAHADAKLFVTEWQAAADEHRNNFAQSSYSTVSEAWLAAFRGEEDAANAMFERAIELGHREPLFLNPNYRLPLQSEIALDGAIAKMLQAINVERAQLELAPLVLEESQ